MLLAPALGEPPRAIAERLGEALGERLGAAVERVEIAGPGFLNLFMADAWYLEAPLAGSLDGRRATTARRADGRSALNVEFVSANPTGPITVGLRTPRRLRRLALRGSSSSPATRSSASTT